jgi:hypothetical protein
MKDRDYWPIVVQVGVDTGITCMVFAADDCRINKELYLEKNIVCFYKLRR